MKRNHVERCMGLAALALCLSAGTASALKVTWTTGGTTHLVFQDDFEETYGGGVDGDRDPVADTGTWTAGESISNLIQVLSESSVPGYPDLPTTGAYEGDSYLRIISTTPPTNASGVATLSKGAVSEGSLRVEWMQYVPVGSGYNPVTAGKPSTLGVVALMPAVNSSPPNLATWVAVCNRSVGNIVSNSLAYYDGVSYKDLFVQGSGGLMGWTANKWQKWTLDFTFVPGVSNDTWQVTIDGVKSAVVTVNEEKTIGVVKMFTNAYPVRFHVDAVPTDLPLLLHCDFEEPGAGPWTKTTDKAGPHYISEAVPIGGGTLNLTNFNGGHGLLIGHAGPNAADGIPVSKKAATLGQGTKDEFDIDYGQGLIVEATFQFTNHTRGGYIASKTPFNGAGYGGWALSYYGRNANVSFSNAFNFAISREGSTAGVNRQTTFKVTDAAADHLWKIKAEWYPYTRGAIMRIKLHDLTDNTIQSCSFTDTTILTQTNIVRTTGPLYLGTSTSQYYPFPGIIDDIKVYGWGEPVREPPPPATIMILR